jgi:hypothetical protein
MALYKGTITTAISGKIDGLVFAHNPGGKYIRNFAVPTNPNTIFQQEVRAFVAILTAAWQTVLSQPERDAWQLYADNVTVTNRLGDQINIPGISMYVRCNVARMQVTGDAIQAAPIIFNMAQLAKAIANNATVAGQTVDINFGATIPADPWIIEAGSRLQVYISRPQNSGINYFKGPYRFAGAIEGDAVPPTSPFTVGVPFPIGLGQRLFTRCVVTALDGRISSPFFSNSIVVA